MSALPAQPCPPPCWLSILIPVYNTARYLAECLHSVLPQIDAGVQVVLLDDASSDDSRAVMEQLAQRWPGRLELLHHAQNRGLSVARNTMLDHARGEYLWFLDSDDMLLPGAVASLRAAVQAGAPDMVLCDFALWREAGGLKNRLRGIWRGEGHRTSFHGPGGRCCANTGHQLLLGLFGPGQFHVWSKIARRALWEQAPALRFPPGRYFEDLSTMPLLAMRCASFHHCPRPWVAYRQRGGSILASMSTEKALDWAEALRPLRDSGLQDSASAALQLAWAWQCARACMGAARHVGRLPPGEQQALAPRLRNAFEQSSPLDARALLRACLRQRWWLRHAKFRRRWLALGQPDAKTRAELWLASALHRWRLLRPCALEAAPQPRFANYDFGPVRHSPRGIPPVIWSWWDTPEPPGLVQRCVDGWRRCNPGFRVHLLHDSTLARHLPHIPEYLVQLPPARRSDWLRLALLRQHGGIWLDASTILTRSLDWVLQEQAGSGADFVGWWLEAYTRDAACPVVENWFMAAVPGSPFIARLQHEFATHAAPHSGAQYITHLRQRGGEAYFQQLRQRINMPEYLSCHLAMQAVLRAAGQAAAGDGGQAPGFRLRLARAEDGPYHLHALGRWNRSALKMRLLFAQTRQPPPLVKLRSPDRRRLDLYLERGLYVPGSLVQRHLMAD